jgi:two-component system sensor kinase FixL
MDLRPKDFLSRLHDMAGAFSAFVDRRVIMAGRVRYALVLLPLWIIPGRLLVKADIWGGMPFLLLTPSVLLAGALGGIGPGLCATGLGLLLGAVLIDVSVTAVWQGLVFLAIGLGAALFGEILRRSRFLNQARLAELETREARLESLIDTAPDAVILIDSQGVIQSFSKSAARLFGYSAEEAVGRNVSLLMPAPYRTHHDHYMERYEETSEAKIIGIGRVVVGERKDGSTFPIELAVGEMRIGGTRFYTGFLRDLSERQSTEARLQELQSELVHMSRLTALGELSSALAHEVNQPLSAISNYLMGVRRLLKPVENDPAQARVRDALDRATEQALRAGEIIRRLRDFVRRGETDQRAESLAKIVEEASALALVGAKEQAVRVMLRLDPACDQVLADRVQVQQVLINLMRNAIEAMAGSARRELVVVSRPSSGDLVEVSVSDTGPGLEEKVRARLFQPFFTTKASGMGVGLSICRTIIDAHGGTIRADANPEGGAVFIFTLRRSGQSEETRRA